MRERLIPYVQKALELGAHDLHIKSGFPAVIRVAGAVRRLDMPPLSPKELEVMVAELLGEQRIAELRTHGHSDCPYEIENVCRMRLNVFLQRNSLAVSMRLVPNRIRELSDLGFTLSTVDLLTKVQKGMILFTGATNSGKSTTLAALIHHLARQEPLHIISIEDPIEYVFQGYEKSIVSQRQVGEDTPDFHAGLSAALREDPDVIVIGELRDQESVETSLKAAETGHLVLATLHTGDAVQSITRMINIFPSYQRDAIRYMLSSCLKVILSQTLIPATDGRSRVLVYEVLPMLASVCNLLRQRKIHEIGAILRIGRNAGCVPRIDILKNLLRERKINEADIPRDMKKELYDQEMRGGTA
ncbi:MAG: PilT/PilU family type 4a pilus ATPase [Candidatus Riflebacteria bacterium]|nr:PilT/PilU family type 4a pilus ATPase [Candidatus Riflebacteria bacterium]